MNRHLFIPAMLVVISLCISSCSGGKTKKNAEPPQAPAPTEQALDGKATAVPGTPAVRSTAAPVQVVNRTPAELIAALPCKLEGKAGVFAVFPDNPISGQVCFGVYPLRGNEREAPKFDIRGGGMHIISHYTNENAPPEIVLMKWEERGGGPCLETACGKAVPAMRESYSAPGEPGWTYTIITPGKTIDLASLTGGYMGLIIGTEKYAPFFH